ncbi:hypothetical protein PENSPDRAFT_510825 [Peniophora sp. CONT]|nr:hypothetical protein PENSPDRAFT_510825 [Peniophora sp. CONT]
MRIIACTIYRRHTERQRAFFNAIQNPSGRQVALTSQPALRAQIPPSMAYNFSEVQLDSPVAGVKSVANFRAFPLLLESVLIGVFTVQTAFFIHYRSSRKRTKSRLPVYMQAKQMPCTNLLLGLAICLYLLAVACWAIDIALLRQDLLVLLPNQLSSNPDPKIYDALAELRAAEQYGQAILQVVIWSISDCIALWRAYAILEKPRWLGYTILSLLFLEFADYIVYLVLYLYIFPSPPRFIVILWQRSGGLIGTAPFAATSAFTAAVQAFATSLIFYKAWAILKSRQGLFCGPGRNFRTLCIFIESGVAYTALWIWYAIGSDDIISSNTTAAWTDSYVIPLTAMYPTLVIMIVTMQDPGLADVDNLPSRASSFRFTVLPGPRDVESGMSSEPGHAKSTPPQIEFTNLIGTISSSDGKGEKDTDTVG